MDYIFAISIFKKDYVLKGSFHVNNDDESPESSENDNLVAADSSDTEVASNAAMRSGVMEIETDEELQIIEDKELQVNKRLVGFTPNVRS